MKNPALTQELRYEPASVIPLKQESSLIGWLQANNRLIPREPKEKEFINDSEDPEIDELMGNEEDFEEDDDFDLED